MYVFCLIEKKNNKPLASVVVPATPAPERKTVEVVYIDVDEPTVTPTHSASAPAPAAVQPAEAASIAVPLALVEAPPAAPVVVDLAPVIPDPVVPAAVGTFEFSSCEQGRVYVPCFCFLASHPQPHLFLLSFVWCRFSAAARKPNAFPLQPGQIVLKREAMSSDNIPEFFAEGAECFSTDFSNRPNFNGAVNQVSSGRAGIVLNTDVFAGAGPEFGKGSVLKEFVSSNDDFRPEDESDHQESLILAAQNPRLPKAIEDLYKKTFCASSKSKSASKKRKGSPTSTPTQDSASAAKKRKLTDEVGKPLELLPEGSYNNVRVDVRYRIVAYVLEPLVPWCQSNSSGSDEEADPDAVSEQDDGVDRYPAPVLVDERNGVFNKVKSTAEQSIYYAGRYYHKKPNNSEESDEEDEADEEKEKKKDSDSGDGSDASD